MVEATLVISLVALLLAAERWAVVAQSDRFEVGIVVDEHQPLAPGPGAGRARTAVAAEVC